MACHALPAIVMVANGGFVILLERMYLHCLRARQLTSDEYNVVVDSKLTGPVYVAHDLSGSSLRVFQPCAEIISRTVGRGATISGTLDPWVEPVQAGWARSVSISWPSA